MPIVRGRADLLGAAVKPRTEPKPLTQFKVAEVRRPELERPLALVTIDNGADHTKPTVFGRSAFASLERILGELESDDWAALVITGKPYFFSAGADLEEFSLRAGGANRLADCQPVGIRQVARCRASSCALRVSCA